MLCQHQNVVCGRGHNASPCDTLLFNEKGKLCSRHSVLAARSTKHDSQDTLKTMRAIQMMATAASPLLLMLMTTMMGEMGKGEGLSLIHISEPTRPY